MFKHYLDTCFGPGDMLRGVGKQPTVSIQHASKVCLILQDICGSCAPACGNLRGELVRAAVVQTELRVFLFHVPRLFRFVMLIRDMLFAQAPARKVFDSNETSDVEIIDIMDDAPEDSTDVEAAKMAVLRRRRQIE